MGETNLERIKHGLVGIRDHVQKMVEKEQQKIKDFEKLVLAHYHNEITENDILKAEEQYRLDAENDQKEIDDIMEKLKDKLRALGLSEEEIKKQVGQ